MLLSIVLVPAAIITGQSASLLWVPVPIASFAAERNPVSSFAFPPVNASNLNRTKLALPADFAGKINLLLIAFEQHQQNDVNTWIPAAKELEKTYPNIRYYELPTLFRGTFFFRAWLDSAMRSGIKDIEARERTVTLYLDKARFRQSLGIESEHQICVLLADRSGNIHWRTEGPFGEEKKLSLLDALKRVLEK